MTWAFPCPTGDCPSERVHRPYAKRKNSKGYIPSFSAFGDLLSGGGEGLVMHGVGEAVTVIPWVADEIAALDLPEAIRRVRNIVSARGSTDQKLGTRQHAAGEAFANGEGWTEPPEDELPYQADRDRLWEFVGATGRWFDARQPVVHATEFIVSDDKYVATGDLIVDIDDTCEYVDYKTHRKHKPDESGSFAKWWLQCQMISNARDLRHYHGKELVATIPWDGSGLPRPTQGRIVSIGPEGQLREYVWPIIPRDELTPFVDALAVVLAFETPKPRQVSIPKYENRPDAPVNIEAML